MRQEISHAEGLDSWAEALVAGRTGDHHALEGLFTELIPWWARLAMRVVGDRETARDVAQDAALHLLSRLQRFDPGRCRRAKGWLARLLINRAIDHLRRRHRHRALSLSDADSLLATDEAPSRQAERQEQADRLRALLVELQPRERTAVHLRFERGLTFTRIAEELHLSLSGAYRVVNGAVAKLTAQGPHEVSSNPGRGSVNR